MADVRSLVAALRRYPDPVTSADPLTSALVARLATLPAPPQASPGFRDDLRAQLVAVTPRLVAEGTASDAAVTSRPGRVRAAWRRVPFRRPLAVVGTLVVIFGMLLTGAVWLSSSSMPGDSLYGLKRASENVQLSLLNGDGARGKEYLTLAKRRTSEVAKLLSRSSSLGGAPGVHAAGGINSHTAKLVTDTLNDADADTRNASRLLTGQAVRNSSHDPLRALLSWAPDQVSRLTDIAGRVPAGSLHDRAVGSQQLAERVLDRANRLDANIGCSCLSATSSDDLGPLPCTVPCNPPASKSVPPLQAPAQTAATGPPTGGGASTAPSILPSTISGSGASASLPVIPGLPTPTGSASLPTGVLTGPGGSSSATGTATGSAPASGPVVLDSCGLHVQLGQVGVGLGPCGLHLHL
jgi:hypothetical protein